MIGISFLIILGCYVLNKRGVEVNKEKLTIYECGFQTFSQSQQISFYIKYFLVAIIFLIFDLETMLVYPISFAIGFDTWFFKGFFIFFIFFFILILGLVFELFKGLLPQS